jgi:hypothetical protein
MAPLEPIMSFPTTPSKPSIIWFRPGCSLDRLFPQIVACMHESRLIRSARVKGTVVVFVEIVWLRIAVTTSKGCTVPLITWLHS